MALEIIQDLVNRSLATISRRQKEDSNERNSFALKDDEIHESQTDIKYCKYKTHFFAPGHP